MKKLFKQLKPGDTVFLVGSPDFIMHEDLVENFGIFIVKTIIPTLDGKRIPISCISGEYTNVLEVEKRKTAYLIAPEDDEIFGHQGTIRIDEWSEKFTRTISSNNMFLCFPDVNSGLNFLETKFNKYLEDIKISRGLNDEVLKNKNND